MKYLLYFLVSINFIYCSNNKDRFREKFISSEYDGIVIDMYNDKKNHNVNILIVKTSDDTLKLYSHIFPNLWANAQTGDSIHKKHGNSYLTLKNSVEAKTFEIKLGD